MKRFVEGVDRGQSTLFPASYDDYVTEQNPVRAVDVFVDGLDLEKLGFVGVQPLDTGRPSYHPGTMLKLYIYGYLNRRCSGSQWQRRKRRDGLGWLPSASCQTTLSPARTQCGYAPPKPSRRESDSKSVCRISNVRVVTIAIRWSHIVRVILPGAGPNDMRPAVVLEPR